MSLREKLRQLQTDAPPLDTGGTIATWRHAVEALYRKVQEYLADYASDGLVTFETREVERSEERLGTYIIGLLLINMGHQVVVFSPESRYAIGGDGRVDVYIQGYLARKVRLRWLPSPTPSGTWAISLEAWASPGRTHRTVRPLTKATLEEALELLLG